MVKTKKKKWRKVGLVIQIFDLNSHSCKEVLQSWAKTARLEIYITTKSIHDEVLFVRNILTRVSNTRLTFCPDLAEHSCVPSHDPQHIFLQLLFPLLYLIPYPALNQQV